MSNININEYYDYISANFEMNRETTMKIIEKMMIYVDNLNIDSEKKYDLLIKDILSPLFSDEYLEDHDVDGNIFEYQGFHYKPVGKLPEKMTFKEISVHLYTHEYPYLATYDDAYKSYNYEDFNEVSNSKDDVFLCIETGKVCLPTENYLFYYDGDYITDINITIR